jgi:hypothetical protein
MSNSAYLVICTSLGNFLTMAGYVLIPRGWYDPACTIKGNISPNGERIYPVPGQHYYDDTRVRRGEGERWFCNVEEARAAGWRKARYWKPMNTNTIAALAGALGLIVAAVIAIGDAFQLPGWFQVVAVLLSVFLLSYTHVRWLRKQR